MNKIVRYFPDTDLRSGHLGLSLRASKNKINVNSLGTGEFLIFVNRTQTALKLYAAGNVIAHYKKSDGGKIDTRAIAHIPRYFNGSAIHYDKALEDALRRDFGKRFL